METRHLLGLFVGLAVLGTAMGIGDEGHEAPASASAACGASSADVSWSAVRDAHLSGYDVYERASGAPDYTKANVALVTGTGHTVSGLASATTYEFRIVAVYNDGHESAMSPAASCTTG